MLSITSGKGGVGKTHVTVNMGLALVKQGKRVLLLDADFGLANINVLLDMRTTATLDDVAKGTCTIEKVIQKHSSGLDIIPSSSGLVECTSLAYEQRVALVSALEGLAFQYDYVLVDTGAGIGDNVLFFNGASEHVFVVINQEPTSITDAYALIKVLSSKSGVRDFHIIVNRVPTGKDGRHVFGQLASTTERFLNVNLHYLGAIAEDRSVVEAVLKQQPFLSLYPGAKASQDIQALARGVLALPGTRKTSGGMQFFLESLLGAKVSHG